MTSPYQPNNTFKEYDDNFNHRMISNSNSWKALNSLRLNLDLLRHSTFLVYFRSGNRALRKKVIHGLVLHIGAFGPSCAAVYVSGKCLTSWWIGMSGYRSIFQQMFWDIYENKTKEIPAYGLSYKRDRNYFLWREYFASI